MKDELPNPSRPKVLEATNQLRFWTDSLYKEPRLEQWHANRCEPFGGEWVAVPLVIEEPPFRR